VTDHRRLDGRTVLVAGGAHGMGAAQAQLFAERGASVVVGDVLADDAAVVADKIGESAVACKLDVASADDWDAAIDLGLSSFGRPVTGMVNNAGVSVTRTIERSTVDDYLSVVMVNQVGAFLGIRACIPTMRDAGGGSIVTISSILGHAAMAASSGYVSSKFAIRGLSRVAALELSRWKIRVNTICPGTIDTRMIRAGDEEPEALAPLAKQIPLGHVGDPVVIATAADFLLSDDASYVTGTDLVVDGGAMARIPVNLKR
jgi:3alpha(or 20beta)-hydroxysteroid dehydrogenase